MYSKQKNTVYSMSVSFLTASLLPGQTQASSMNALTFEELASVDLARLELDGNDMSEGLLQKLRGHANGRHACCMMWLAAVGCPASVLVQNLQESVRTIRLLAVFQKFAVLPCFAPTLLSYGTFMCQSQVISTMPS